MGDGMDYERWGLHLKEAEKNTAKDACVKCANEETCGYSAKATTGERSVLSFGPCGIGLFEKKQHRLHRPPAFLMLIN